MYKKLIIKIILLFFTAFMIISGTGFADENLNADIKIIGDHNPAISRFVKLTGVISKDTASKLYRHSLKIYINGSNRTLYLQSESVKTGEILLSYDPIKALPTGQVNIVLKAMGVGEKTYSQKISFVVNPAADPALASYYRSVMASPRNVSARIKLGKAYENKYLFKDAAYQYRMALTYSPKNKEAINGWNRVFAALDVKSITIRDITLDTAIDEGVDMLGNLVLFKVRIINSSPEVVNFDPQDTLLTVDSDYQLRPIGNLADYPGNALEKGVIDMDQYGRIKYYLGTKNFTLLEKTKIQPGIAITGYLGYELKYPHFKNLNLWIRLKTDPKLQISFKIPFKKP
ncbi:MAG: hypothetical protein ABIH00_08865 [Armatimonadota bacterium]